MATTEEEVVGRPREVEAIARFVDELPAGHRSLVIVGEAGIGKTTLWRAGVAAAERGAYRVCRCRPAQAETEMGFAALIDLLGDVPEDALESLPGPQRRALEVALLRREPQGRGVDQRAVARAVLGMLETLAESQPVVVAVDDVQWLDRSSARVLQFVFRRVRDAPIGVLASARVGTATAVIESLSEGPSTELVVGPLSMGAIHHLIRTRLGPKFPRPLLGRIHEVSGGNPFFALEIARGLERRGVRPRPDEALPIPTSLGELVRERLIALGPDARAALLLAAACSHPTVPLVRAAIGHDVHEALDRAISADVIEPVTDTIEFTHPLLASVLYADAPPSERREAHARLATVAAEPEERARHLGLVAEGPDAAVAAALDAAARITRARGAPSAAAGLCLLARDVTPRDRVRDTAERVMEAADHHFAAGDASAAQTLLEGLVASQAAGPLRADALNRLAGTTVTLGRFDDAARLMEQALEEARDDHAIKSRAHDGLAWVKVLLGDVAAARAHARDALALAEAIGDEKLLVAAMTGAAFTGFLLGEGLDDDLMSRALALEDHAAHLPAERRPGPMCAILLVWDDRPREGRTQLLRALDLYLERGDEGALPVVLYFLAHAEWPLGLWDDACEHLDAAYDRAEGVGFESLLAFILAVRAFIFGARGDTENARSQAARAAELAEATGSPMAMAYSAQAFGAIELSVGDYEAAHARLGSLAPMLVAMPVDTALIARICGDDARALIALGDLDGAAALVEAMEDKARELDRASLRAVAACCRALLAAAQGDLDSALAASAAALSDHARADVPFQRARTLLAKGVIERRARRKQPARASLTEATAIFEGLGATPWADKARAELARIGGRAPAPGDLTPTEAEVADAVARGLSNKEIAAELFMSVNTVESYLKRIFVKLGVHSRTELTARRHERSEPS